MNKRRTGSKHKPERGEWTQRVEKGRIRLLWIGPRGSRAPVNLPHRALQSYYSVTRETDRQTEWHGRPGSFTLPKVKLHIPSVSSEWMRPSPSPKLMTSGALVHQRRECLTGEDGWGNVWLPGDLLKVTCVKGRFYHHKGRIWTQVSR